MELELYRIDYCSVGATLANCLTLLPATNYKEPNRVVVGDQDGILQLFSLKKDELIVHFKTLPSERIQCIRLGGSVSTTADKIFVASDNKVKAYNKKGKMFLTFSSNLTEPIRSMYIMGNDMILCGNHVYNHYRDCKDIGSYLCGDTIVDVAVLCPTNGSRMITILGCSGRVLRILEHCRVRQSVELESVPTVLHVPRGYKDRFFCGMTNGRVVLIKAGPSISNFTQEMIINQNEESSAITTLDAFDLTGDNKLELIVGRRDGTVEVFILPGDENAFDVNVQKIHSQNFNESISCVRGGVVDLNGSSEIIVCTYTGSIFGLSTKCPKKSFSDATINNPGISNVSNGRIDKLREEIRDLEQKVQKECERYKISTQSLSGGFSAIPMLPINSSLNFSQDDASYLLTIEAPAPIEFALLQSNTPIQFIDVEKSSAVVSFSRCDPTAGNYLLASYRCQVDVNRLDLKFRTVEGTHGRLQAFVTPNIQPKVAQMKEFLIKPLSLHMRTHSFNFERPHNQLTLKGVFSNAEIHNWISNCIPEVPEKLQTIPNEKCVLYFKNVLVDSELLCEYTKGEAVFKTENITTISIIKDFITKEATKRRTKLEISLDVKRESVVFMLNLMETKLKPYILNNNEYKLINNLIDLDLQDDFDVTSLGAEYTDAISRKDQIIEAFNEAKHTLDTSITIISRLYIDFHHLNGIEVKQDLPEIGNFVKDFNFNGLLQFFFDEIYK